MKGDVRRSILIAFSVLFGCQQQASEQRPAQDSTAAPPASVTDIDSAAFQTSIDRATLMGPWSTDGESFALAIEETVILYEFDMKEHPYSLRGDTIIVDFQDPALGVQKKLVLRLTADTLVMQDVEYGVSDTLIRVRQ
jgi:hypothetical protein